MIIKKSGGAIIGADLSNAERKAMRIEINKQIAEHTRKHLMEIDATFLWYMMEAFNFKPKQLKRIFTEFSPMLHELCARYEMFDKGDDIWLCTQKLKERGVDLEEWMKEVGE